MILISVVVEAHLLKNETAEYLNIFLHGVNSFTCLIDIFISARPWKLLHFLYPICFGTYYAAFSLIYWGAGGLGVCYKYRTDTATVHSNNMWCDPFIYPILDWQNNPGLAAGVIVGGCLVMPLIHLFWMGLAWIRQTIYEKCLGNSSHEKHHLPINL